MTTDPTILRQRLRAAMRLLTWWRTHARDLERQLAQREALLTEATQAKAEALIDNARLRARIARLEAPREINLKPASSRHTTWESIWHRLTK